jgi:integrase
VFTGCKFHRLADISASRVFDFIARLRTYAPPTGNRKQRQQLSLQTLNYYLRSCKQFCRWAIRDRRTADNALTHLQGWNARLDRRHARRALEPEEISWLLTTAQASAWQYRGMTGRDRHALYAVALGTGLRAGELASLTPDNFRLEEDPPVVHLLAAYAKNEKEVDQPIPCDVVTLLRGYLADKSTQDLVWPGTWSERSARMFQHDLEEARQRWLAAGADAEERAPRAESSFLAYRDGAGLVADFHALRHSFITLLAKSGVSPKLAQSLARHSDINLTMSRYTHVVVQDQATALAALPQLVPPRSETTGEEKAVG